jgi:hypothetical protein
MKGPRPQMILYMLGALGAGRPRLPQKKSDDLTSPSGFVAVSTPTDKVC